MKKCVPILLLVVSLLAFAGKKGEEMSADLIITNADVWTGDPAIGTVEALAIKGDKIVFAGPAGEVTRFKGSETRTIDAGKKFVMPGFIDNHTHFVDGGFSLLGIKLREARDERELAALLGEYAKTVGKGAWITGGSWDHESWPSRHIPHRNMIDTATLENPVFVDRLDGHMALANSLALRMAGIDRNTKDVPGGEIVRDANGEPTGILKDAAMDLVTRIIPPRTEQEKTKAIQAAMREANRLGVTAVNAMCGAEDVRLLQQFNREGRLSVRVYAITPIEQWTDLRDGGITRGFRNDFLTIGAVKGFMDGSLGSTTAWFFDPYADAPDSRGLPAGMYFPEGNMRKLISGADRADLHVVVHAIGDRANQELLQIYAEVVRENGDRDRRFRIEHAQHLTPQSIASFKAQGVIASMQPYHLADDGRWAEKRIGAARLPGTYAFRDLLNQGATVTFGSDWPVVSLDPLLGFKASVTRQTLDGKNPAGWVPNQKLTVEEALRCYTVNNAYAMFAEKSMGTLSPGKLADVVILSESPFRCPPERIDQLKVQITVVGGKIVFGSGS